MRFTSAVDTPAAEIRPFAPAVMRRNFVAPEKSSVAREVVPLILSD